MNAYQYLSCLLLCLLRLHCRLHKFSYSIICPRFLSFSFCARQQPDPLGIAAIAPSTSRHGSDTITDAIKDKDDMLDFLSSNATPQSLPSGAPAQNITQI